MSPQEFREVCEKLTEHSLDTMMRKQSEYSKDSDDVLVAFKKAADLQGITSRQALAGMMAKHTVSVYDMLTDPDLPDEAHVFEKLGDHINYLYLAWAVIWEDRNNLIDEMCEASEEWNGPTGEDVGSRDFVHDHDAVPEWIQETVEPICFNAKTSVCICRELFDDALSAITHKNGRTDELIISIISRRVRDFA